MKSLALIFLALISTETLADEWTTADVYREATYISLHAVDWLQTRSMAKNGWDEYHERNVILGRFPKVSQVNTYFALTAIGHIMLANVLSSKWRESFQYGTTGLEFGVILSNHSIGVRIRF